MNIYEGAFVNTETNTANENIQQIITVRIFDTETAVDVPYNFRFIVSNNGDGTQTVSIFSDPFPDVITAASFGYFNVSWIDTPISLEGRTSIVIPEGDWLYSFVVTSDLGDTRRLLTEGETVDLEMGETPLNFSVIDNSEDKFTPIKSKQVEIQIHSSNTVDISKFADGGDNRFQVEIETQAEGIIFKGFLSVEDLRQEFLPDPNIIILTATDGLGFLENEPLVNFNNETPANQQKIISFLVWALAKTGLMLDVKVCMNIRENFSVPLVSDDTGEGHFYDYIYLDSKTFEDEIGTCEDCFTVLEKILGENSFITQYKGKWLILRIDEMETGHEYFFTRFNYLGVFVEKTTETYSKDIGVNLSLSWMNDDCEVSLIRPYKAVIEKFNYEYPEELVCNIDFARGDFIEDLPDETIDGVVQNVKKYTLDCWQWLTRQAGAFIYNNFGFEPLSSADVYVKKFYVNDTEKNKELVIKASPGTGAGVTYIQSSLIPVGLNDKIELGIDLYYTNIGSSSGFLNSPVLVALFADNGNIYWWRAFNVLSPNDPGEWVLIAPSSALTNGIWYAGAAIQDPPLSVSFTSPAIPATGNVRIFLPNEYGNEITAHYNNLRIDVITFINGSYQTYIGQQNKLSQDNSKIKAVRETEVFISDAPRINLKGALLKQNAGSVLYSGNASFDDANIIVIPGDVFSSFSVGQKITVSGSVSNNVTGNVINVDYIIIGNETHITIDADLVNESSVVVTITEIIFVLAGMFYNAALFPAGPGTLMPYGQLQAIDVWNQFNRVMRTFEGVIDRIDSSTQLPDLLHKYILRDIDPNTTNGTTQYRIFMLPHFEMNMHLCEWNAYLIEVFNTDNAKIFETHEFKYITE